MSSWHRIMAFADLPEHEIFPFSCAGRAWILLRSQDELRCYVDRCSHQDIRLSEFGRLDGTSLVCLAHGARFDCGSGDALRWPAQEALEKGDVKVEKGEVFLWA